MAQSTTKTAREIKGRTIAEQFVDSKGVIWSLQVKPMGDGRQHGKVVSEFYGRGVKSYKQTWHMELIASGPMSWLAGEWEKYKRYSA